MKFSAVLLQRAMHAHGWDAEAFSAALKNVNYDVKPKIVQKWCTGKLLPNAQKIGLMEQVLGHSITVPPEPRRTFSYSPT